MSDPSPIEPQNPSTAANEAMTASTKALPFSLTLILAATPSLGIGKSGTLPWPQLKKEMGYFARVTKRIPPKSRAEGDGIRRCNAVLMGRKTWDSIPEKFRPLKGRVNVVVTRKPEEFGIGKVGKEEGVEGPVVAGSITAALEQLKSLSQSSPQSDATSRTHIERIFVIGGGSIYEAALQLPQTDRVLLTKIQKEYDCDTFFPVDLDGQNTKWRKAGQKALEEFTEESVDGGGVEEAGVRFEFCLYEKETTEA